MKISRKSSALGVEKYVDIPEMTPVIVKFVKTIIIYTHDKSSGKRTQKDGVTIKSRRPLRQGFL